MHGSRRMVAVIGVIEASNNMHTGICLRQKAAVTNYSTIPLGIC